MCGSLSLRLERLHTKWGLHLWIMWMLESRPRNEAVAWAGSIDHRHVHRVVILLWHWRTKSRVDHLAMRIKATHTTPMLEQEL